MVAPVIIAGLTGLGGMAVGVLADILGKKGKKLYGVVCLVGSAVKGQVFPDFDQAVRYQDELARRGKGSILVEKDETGDYKGLKSVRAVAAGGRRISPKKLRNTPSEYVRQYGSKMGVGAKDFDTVEEQEDFTQLTTRFPTPEWAKRAKDGPFPDTDPGRQSSIPEIEPLFRETTSSHEWETDVRSWEVPSKFFPGRRGTPGQPESLTVDQKLQYPERPDTRTIPWLKEDREAQAAAAAEEGPMPLPSLADSPQMACLQNYTTISRPRHRPVGIAPIL